MKRYSNENVSYRVCLIGEEEDKKRGGYLKTRCLHENEKTSVIEVGMGERKEWSPIRCKEVYAFAAQQVIEMEGESAAFEMKKAMEWGGDSTIYSAVEGIVGGGFQIDTYKTEKEEKSVPIWYLICEEEQEEQIQCAENLAYSVLLARNLVDMPANKLTPKLFAERLLKEAGTTSIEAEVIGKERASQLGMGAFLAVGESSGNEPQLLVFRYHGDPSSEENIGYIGKGITIDTGGYCVKSAASLKGSKGDMAGAAAVFGAVLALAKNRVKTNVTAVIPACENRISDTSYLPGDVLTSMSKKTIEVLNTDAEGRLILADAITYAIRCEHVTKLLDIATLTGAVVTMFGFTTAGAMSNDDIWYECLERASKRSGEQYWRLPTFPEYDKMIDSRLADVCNVSKDGCGTITAGMFLKRFTEELPWIHLDIAGTACVDSPKWKFQTAGATGAGVPTLYYLAQEK